MPSHARLQHTFILPEDLRPRKLVGSGISGVVLCCTTDSGAMVAVKKIHSDTDHALQRSLREVLPVAGLHIWLSCRLTLRQVLLMCQLRHPNIVSAEDIYMPSDISQATHAARAQCPPAAARPHDLFVRMPYYPADLAWLIHSSPQVLTRDHIQARMRGAAC